MLVLAAARLFVGPGGRANGWPDLPTGTDLPLS